MHLNKLITKKDSALLEYGEDKALLIDIVLIKKLSLTEGSDFDMRELLKENEDFSKRIGMDMSMNYLSFSSRTERQMRKFLYEKHIQKKSAEYIIEKLKEYKFIDDMAYAQTFVKDSILAKKGKGYIRNKLREKFIDDSFITAALETYTNSEQSENAEEFIGRKNKMLKKYPPAQRKEKLYRSALQQGFSSSIIMPIVAKILSADDGNYEEFYSKLIDKKISILKNRELSYNELRTKLYTEFIKKGADRQVIEKCLNEAFPE